MMSFLSESRALTSLPLAVLLLVACLASIARSGPEDYNIQRADIAGQHPLIRWNPCQAISYAVNLRRITGGRHSQLRALLDVQEALRMLSDASGLTFVFRGLTDEVPYNRWGGDWHEHQHSAELVIAWVGDGETDLLDGGAAGTGGWSMKAYSADGGRNYHAAIGRGFVVLRASEQSKFTPGFGIGNSRGALLLHELMHALGMGHVSSKAELMYPRLDNAYTMARFGRGDLNGLRLLGSASGCFPVPVEQWIPL